MPGVETKPKNSAQQGKAKEAPRGGQQHGGARSQGAQDSRKAAAPAKELTPEELEAQRKAQEEKQRVADEVAAKAAAEAETKRKAEEEAKAKAAEEAARKAAEEEAKKPEAQRIVERIAKALGEKKAAIDARVATIKEVKTVLDGAHGRACEPYLVSLVLPQLLELSDDKATHVRTAADEAAAQLVAASDAYGVTTVIKTLFGAMTIESKWRSKKQALVLLESLAKTKSKTLSLNMSAVITTVSDLMHDIKPEVADAAREAIVSVCKVIANRDIEPFIPALISSMANLHEVPETVAQLASTTFVQTVEAPALSMIVPLLVRGFREKNVAVKRQCSVIVANMSRLVEDASEASPFLPELLPALQRAAEEISDPEARTVAAKAQAQLERIREAAQAADAKSAAVLEAIQALVKGLAGDKSDAFKVVVEYLCTVCGALIACKQFDEAHVQAHVAPFVSVMLPADAAATACQSLLAQFARSSNAAADAVDDANETAPELCNCRFTLAYGSKILLHNTDLKLRRGHRYGLLGGNDSGKTTLMRSIANGQVEGFPPATELRTVFVEADIQGEQSHKTCIDYVFTDERIIASGVSREDVAKIMSTVGFTEKMQNDAVTTLSGGWRMKLALARAMLQRADILLLDEPTNHLDVINVQWVISYLNSLTDVTSIIVSHDANLLDKCCTHMLHIDNLKLHLHKGNLSEFVKKCPAAQSFFELGATKFKFKFPQPGYLEGVKSKGKALMKMEGVSFTYPGNDKPTLTGVTVQVSLSSRVACLGVNGAGKSTMIKLLTGQLEPAVGSVWKYPNARVAYVAQHAFNHIEQHLNKTANEYIRWRYATGEDKEGLEKASMVITAEDEAKMNRLLVLDQEDEKGNLKKIKLTIDRLMGGRRQGKRELEYEVCFSGMSMDSNQWLVASVLEQRGFAKLMKQVDSKVEAMEGQYARPLTQENVEKHLEDVGLEREFGTHNRIAALSCGQKVKVVLAAAMWCQPHILILDEPTNYLDRDSLGALAGAIREYEGGVVMITHNNEFCSALCPETWVLEHGVLNCKGDAEWMANALKEKTEFKMVEEVVDANGNLIKVKQPKKQLSRKERMARERRKKVAMELGEPFSESEEED